MTLRFLLILFLIGEMGFSQQTYELTVYFDTDVSILNTSEQQKIKDVLNELNVHRIYEISVDGYCDDRANEAYNLELSQKRAEHVKTFFDATLKNKRIKVTLEGKGEIALDSVQNVAMQRQQNRRVDIVIVTLPGTNVNYVSFAQIGDRVVLQNVLFEANRHALIQESLPTLDSLSQFFLENINYEFRILGHICCRKKGSVDAIDDDTGERGLSQNRAKVIYDFFIRKGIAAQRMSYKGLKADFPLGNGDELDRRVEIEIVRK